MARLKKGLDYFHFDVDFFDDIKIRKLIRYHGCQSVVVYQLILTRIYKEGYYLLWDEDIAFIISEISHLQDDTVKEVIQYCVDIGLFNKTLYEKDNVLTSPGIQHRFFDFCVIAKRKIDALCPYLLIDLSQKALKYSKIRNNTEQSTDFSEQSPEEAVIIPDDSEKEADNSDFGTQSKVKKSKVKHSSSAETRTRGKDASAELSDNDRHSLGSVDDEIAELRASPLWVEQVFMRFKFLQSSQSLLDDFLQRWGQEVKISGKMHQDLGDAKHHFCSWMSIQESKLNKNTNSNGTSDNNGYRTREDIDDGTLRTITRMSAAVGQAKTDLPVV